MFEIIKNKVKALLYHSDGKPVDSTTPIPTMPQPYVPLDFTKQTSSSRTFLIQKGQLNHYRLRPSIVNEHVETARQSHGIVSSGNHVGQIFKASQDNINGITLTLESAAGISFDDFESYADDAALQVEWIETDVADPATLELTIVPPNGGSKSMRIPSDATEGDEWYKALPSPTDFTDYIGEFDFYNDRSYADVKMRVYVYDTLGNSSSGPIVNTDSDVWEHIEIDVNLLTADGVTAADITQITRIGFRLDDRKKDSFVYFDNLISVPKPGSVSVELWDMGASIPVSGVTSISDGTQYDELGDRGINSGSVHSSVSIDMIGGKRQYFIDGFVAGVALEIPSNTPLIVDNYYALVIKYVDTNVTVYGSNTSYTTNYYENGYAFTAPDDSTAITSAGQYADIQFGIFSVQDVYVNTLLKFYNAAPGDNSTESVYIENKEMQIEGIVANNNNPQQTILAEFRDRSFYFPKGGKFEVNHNDDFSDSITQVTILIGYMYKPYGMNG